MNRDGRGEGGGDRGGKGGEEGNEEGRKKTEKEGRGGRERKTRGLRHTSQNFSGHCDFIANRSQDSFIEKKQETCLPPGTSSLSHRHKVIKAPPDPRGDGGPPTSCQ